MKLLFAQHGQAETEDRDPDRPLTEDGRRHTELVARAAAAVGVTVGSVWHSGKLRARQTAQIFADALGGTTLSTPAWGSYGGWTAAGAWSPTFRRRRSEGGPLSSGI